jgi:ABC-type polysaccharide/polyol phosphate transport system ATPase subunit
VATIEVIDIVKDFRQYRRFSGLFGAFCNLITREYTINRAVDNISFKIEQGEAVGYLGPNGAGKSTMITKNYSLYIRHSNAFPYRNRIQDMLLAVELSEGLSIRYVSCPMCTH